MSSNGSGRQAISVEIRVRRFDPDIPRRPHMQSFHIQVTPDTTILDALEEIKLTQCGSLTYRRSCRHAICGSCAMNINGQNMLVCNRPVLDVVDRKGRVTIKPLPYLPVIKDLVVDRSSFWEQYRKVRPWLIPPAQLPDDEFRVSPDEVAALGNAEKCIMCGACYSACPVVAFNKQYLGPHALLKAFLRVLDPRDSAPLNRLEDVDGAFGAFRCHTIFNCIDACPKQLDPTQAIETLRKLVQRRVAFDEERFDRQRQFVTPSQGGGPHV